MQITKRGFLKAGSGLLALLLGRAHADLPRQQPEPKAATPTEVPIQISAVAGFQYHAGTQVWSSLEVGHLLTLQRETDNRYDQKAIVVLWNQHKLGYVPRTDNVTLAQMMDRGIPLQARIVKLTQSADPWKRIGMEIRMQV
ncbi:MAG: HIRAN protein [Magnetococcales bacterium]|nr:HIRAN domain-containing protein [Magnetococcales bacterium]NGZ05987.1 HIRAN protein [Magnetococcales bacterium]